MEKHPPTSSSKRSISRLSSAELAPIIREWPETESLDDYLLDLHAWIATETMEIEVNELCGKRHIQIDPEKRRYQRRGSNPGAIRIRSEWVAIDVPRVRDFRSGQEKSLKSYQRLRQLSKKQELRLVNLVYRGLSQRNYKQSVQECAKSHGLSASTVSRIFTRLTTEMLHDFETMDLSGQSYVVVMMDATKIRDKHIMICVGITEAGTKQVLGFAELTSENAKAIESLLARLIRQGLHSDQGLLFVVDGSKGIHRAIKAVYGRYAQIQRCTQHKRENIKGYISCDKARASVERQLNAVYLGQQTYSEAKQALDTLRIQLAKEGYTQAVKSLEEGLEETLTLHRLRVHPNLRSCLRTTNIMESLNATLKERCRKIRRWNSSQQCHRWVVLGLQEADTKMQNISLKKELVELKKTLKKHIQ